MASKKCPLCGQKKHKDNIWCGKCSIMNTLSSTSLFHGCVVKHIKCSNKSNEWFIKARDKFLDELSPSYHDLELEITGVAIETLDKIGDKK